MSSRYIARRYGTKGGGDESRPGSRASMARNDSASRPPSRGELISRPPSRGEMISRPPSRGPGEMISRPQSRGSMCPPSRGPSISRCASPTPSYYASYNGSGGSGRSTPEMGLPGSGNSSRCTTPNNFSEYSALRRSTYPFSDTSQEVTTGWPRRSPSPLRNSYTQILCTASRRLRERSIPPPAPLPEKLEFVRGPPISGKPPAAPARVVASDFYRGKVKSIYEREPLFKDFVTTIPQRYGDKVNIYNTGTLDTIKTDFKAMVEDKWNRSQLQDPSVEMNFGAKVYAWRDMHVKDKIPASARIYRDQNARGPRATTPINNPRVYVYHRSTMSPAPA